MMLSKEDYRSANLTDVIEEDTHTHTYTHTVVYQSANIDKVKFIVIITRSLMEAILGPRKVITPIIVNSPRVEEETGLYPNEL